MTNKPDRVTESVVEFAWTATTDYKQYPSYFNLTGNRLAVRGFETIDRNGHWKPGAYVEMHLPNEALDALLEALTARSQPSRVTESVVELVARLRRGVMFSNGKPIGAIVGEVNDPVMRQAANLLEALTTRSQPGEDAVERAARAIAINRGRAEGKCNCRMCRDGVEHHMDDARAALNAAALPVEGTRNDRT